MENWVIFTFLYAVFTGFLQCAKKKATERNSIYEVLAFFSLIAFLIVAFFSKDVFNIKLSYIYIILIKSLAIVTSWLLSLYALSKMSISLFSVISLSGIIFTITMSVIVLGERLTVNAFFGIIIVILGLFLVNKNSEKEIKTEKSFKLIQILILSCFLASISGIIDKKIMGYITTDQLQFWFFFFLTISYWWILLIRNKKIDFKNIKKNYSILIAAICFAIGDKLFFTANGISESKASIMTIIKQFSVIESIILGKILFKENDITRKLLCSIFIIFGIVLTLL